MQDRTYYCCRATETDVETAEVLLCYMDEIPPIKYRYLCLNSCKDSSDGGRHVDHILDKQFNRLRFHWLVMIDL